MCAVAAVVHQPLHQTTLHQTTRYQTTGFLIMEKLQSQVLLARRRLATQQFMDCLTWALPALMLVAALAVATPKVWVLGFEPQQSLDWVLWWSGSCAVAAFAFAGLWVWAVRRKPFEAAVEIDRRFGLRERISSAWSLGDQERETEVGRALVGDASRRIERIDVREQFRVRMGWPVLLTVLPIAAIVLLTTLVDDAVAKPGNTPADTPEVKKQVKKSAESLKKKIEERRKQATKEGLKDAAHLFKKLEEGADKLAAKSDVDRKQAMVQFFVGGTRMLHLDVAPLRKR